MIPSASRLIESLRDIGYEFPAAVADVIDNCIAAGATDVRVTMEYKGSESRVQISDNGAGMTKDELTEAMRFGSRREYDEDDLGRFGLGMKTATLSHCNVLTVASRSRGKRVQILRWDMDHIRATDRWEILGLTADDQSTDYFAPIQHGSGTVVTWDGINFAGGLKSVDGQHAKNRFMRLCRETEEYLAMVFHRFLADHRLRIMLNEIQLAPWDPFALSEKHTRAMRKRILEVEFDGKRYRVAVQPYILPTEAQFADKKAFSAASGPQKWTRQQGLYIYRGDRLIQSGGWCRLRTQDEHTKLARIAVQFNPEADKAFRINVAKTSINLPEDLIEHLKPIVDETARAADKAYRGKEPKAKGGAAGPSVTPVAPTSGAGSLPPIPQVTQIPPAAPSPVQLGDEGITPAKTSPQAQLVSRLSSELTLDRDTLRKVLAMMVEVWRDLEGHPLVKEVLEA